MDVCAQVIYSVDLCWIKLESFGLRILRVIFGLGRFCILAMFHTLSISQDRPEIDFTPDVWTRCRHIVWFGKEGWSWSLGTSVIAAYTCAFLWRRKACSRQGAVRLRLSTGHFRVDLSPNQRWLIPLIQTKRQRLQFQHKFGGILMLPPCLEQISDATWQYDFWYFGHLRLHFWYLSSASFSAAMQMRRIWRIQFRGLELLLWLVGSSNLLNTEHW